MPSASVSLTGYKQIYFLGESQVLILLPVSIKRRRKPTFLFVREMNQFLIFYPTRCFPYVCPCLMLLWPFVLKAFPELRQMTKGEVEGCWQQLLVAGASSAFAAAWQIRLWHPQTVSVCCESTEHLYVCSGQSIQYAFIFLITRKKY